jgi:hypothetical protein
MLNHSNAAVRGLALLLIVGLPVTGCRTARTAAEEVTEAGAAAGQAVEGAFAAINPTNQGAESLVQGSVSNVDRRTRAVLSSMGLQITKAEYEDNATEREYEARRGERVVHVKLEARGTTSTQVNVSSREGRLDYDKSHARTILERIQRQR